MVRRRNLIDKDFSEAQATASVGRLWSLLTPSPRPVVVNLGGVVPGVVYEQGNTSWGAYLADLPGCVAVGDSRADVEAPIVEVIGAYLENLSEAGQPIPQPRSATGLVEVA